MKENLKTTMNNHVWKVVANNLYWLDDKKCKCYTSYWKGKPSRSWKWNRKTQYKPIYHSPL